MAAARKLYAGAKLREFRVRLGLTQAQYAGKLGVSLSYLNQMENNHRPISARVVLALAQEFGVNVTELAAGASERMVADLREALADPVFAQTAPPLADLQLVASNAPGLARAFLTLHHAHRQTQERLAQLNVERYAAWQPQATPANSRPALRAFAGDVYDGLQAATLGAADLKWAQQHLVILSGLYGVLRPLDRLQPYRLEMGTALATPRGKDLYAYWGDAIAEWLNERLAGEKHPVVVNLASQEYARAALRPALSARVVDVQFEDWHRDRFKIISFFAKKARGAMARWAVQQRARSVKALQGFDTDGYAWDAAASTEDRLVFRRGG
mgnify:CR=1 FL=1